MAKNEDKMTIEDARKLVIDITKRADIPGLCGHRWNLYPTNLDEQLERERLSAFAGSLNLRWEQGWGVNCSLTVKFDNGEKNYGGTNFPATVVSCEMSWGSAGHSVASAYAAVTLCKKVLDLAALIECHLEGHLIETEKEWYERISKEKKDK